MVLNRKVSSVNYINSVTHSYNTVYTFYVLYSVPQFSLQNVVLGIFKCTPYRAQMTSFQLQSKENYISVYSWVVTNSFNKWNPHFKQVHAYSWFTRIVQKSKWSNINSMWINVLASFVHAAIQHIHSVVAFFSFRHLTTG
jgi:hypothetical protein